MNCPMRVADDGIDRRLEATPGHVEDACTVALEIPSEQVDYLAIEALVFSERDARSLVGVVSEV